MAKEEKELLVKDLCGRLPYNPRVRYYYSSIGSAAIKGYSDEGYLSYQNLEDFSIYPKYGLEKTRVYNISPYLRPMSSMTEEEKKEFALLQADFYADGFLYPNQFAAVNMLNWLNAHHFDYCGLIEKGLAFPAPEGMYNN